MPRPRRDEYGVAGDDMARLAVHLEDAPTRGDEVDLLRLRVVVTLGRLTGLERGLGERLRGGVVQLAGRKSPAPVAGS